MLHTSGLENDDKGNQIGADVEDQNILNKPETMHDKAKMGRHEDGRPEERTTEEEKVDYYFDDRVQAESARHPAENGADDWAQLHKMDQQDQDQGGNGDGAEGDDKETSKVRQWFDKVWAFWLKWHLPILLIFFILIGYFRPYPGSKADDIDFGGACFSSSLCVWNSIGSLLVTGIFLISGLKLKTDSIKHALAEWKAAIYGVISILFATTCVAFIVVLGQYGDVPEFSIGLALFCSMPTTLSSAVIITGQAKGNVALALMLTVSTNIIGVFTGPLFASSSIGVYVNYYGPIGTATDDESVNVSVNPVPIILQLIFEILVPLAIGKLLRTWKPIADLVKYFSTTLKLLSSLFLVLIPWMKISSSAESFSQIDGLSFVYMWLTAIGIHIFYLAFNFVFAHFALRLKLPALIAVVLTCSQKTLPVAITVLQYLPTDIIGSVGLVTIPVVVCHLMQILIDSVIASRLITLMDRYEAKENAAETSSSPTVVQSPPSRSASEIEDDPSKHSKV
mmetsp:Transcript_2408/g.5548  ORF Transcript_2408/g.5548 Transcript_2408/m.5548 type:complete len:508 (+) Transcript_2408:152-1675(+)|eukprot:CAMPEP_0171573586 /NCGR_PEP_ID=MMETSP0961-20121227/4848_1 /TAXON_ID=87120 /ORGANISM="Aurantiochytrium limacinum, Strain ATCCMYA-1381" /LENGTH=507 /DNA_ID=CAMNT_0012128735 /DNA_START=285 /DNA_END=1808 /DNA_ORIENTATION=-